MIPEHVEALVLADSVGALDEGERVELAAHLATLSAEQRLEVMGLYQTANVVARTVDQIEPPARVRERVMAAARAPSRYTAWAGEAEWIQTPVPGIRARVLAVDKVRSLVTLLLRADAGAVYPSHQHHGPEECFVIKGTVTIDGRVLGPGDFHHADEGSAHGEITTSDGAEVLLVGALEDYLPG